MPDYLNLRSSALVDPLRNFRFLVSFLPLTAAGEHGLNTTFQSGQKLNLGFMAVQGLAAQTETIPYREGGMNTTPHQLPGQQSFSPVTFQKGVVRGSMLGWEWFTSLYDPGIGSAQVVNDFRFEVEIKVLSYPVTHNRTVAQTANTAGASGPGGTDSGWSSASAPAASFTLLNAWPSNVAYSDLNAADNAVLVEQITVVHEGLVPAIAGGNNGLDVYGTQGAGIG